MSTDITPPPYQSDRDRVFREWHIRELYAYRFWGEDEAVVHQGSGLHVPNEDHAVWDWERGKYRVVSVDYTTGICTLKRWSEPRDSQNVTDDDLLLGSAPSHPSEVFRLYINTAVTPFTLSLDSEYWLGGTDVEYIKIYKGRDVGQNAKAISAFYDQSGNLLGEAIPVELIGYRQDNIAMKRPLSSHTHHRLPDGEIVTLVAYGANGTELSFATLMVHNTGFVRAANPADKYITAISVESPFISPADPTLLEYPVNMPVENLNLIGVVQYSDGSTVRRPVDGTKFEMHGLEEFIASIQEQTIPLVLTYKLSPEEHSYILTPSPQSYISVRYRATTLKNDAAYNLKLFAYPVWQDAMTGYRLEFFLANLERDEIYPVTNLVQLQTGSRAFDPLQYGVVQKIAYAIDLNRVDSRFSAYRHVQSMEVTLLANGTEGDRDNWTIRYTTGGNEYGSGISAVARFINTNNWKIKLDAGIETKAEWLQRVFYNTDPLFDSNTEERAPEPNFFKLVIGSHEIEVPIDMWNSEITSHVAPGEGQNLYLQFFRRNPTTDLYLGVTGMSTHHQ